MDFNWFIDVPDIGRAVTVVWYGFGVIVFAWLFGIYVGFVVFLRRTGSWTLAWVINVPFGFMWVSFFLTIVSWIQGIFLWLICLGCTSVVVRWNAWPWGIPLFKKKTKEY